MDDLIARPKLNRYTPLKIRFWSRVFKTEDCWHWRGANAKGYGQIWVNSRSCQAPRLSWELHYGLIPDGLYVLHTCDNPACVRPDHLFLGTIADNAQDSAQKGRNVAHTKPHLIPRGERHGMAKLTDARVRRIRQSSAAGATQRALAKQFGVSQSVIGCVIRRKAWKHV